MTIAMSRIVVSPRLDSGMRDQELSRWFEWELAAQRAFAHPNYCFLETGQLRCLGLIAAQRRGLRP